MSEYTRKPNTECAVCGKSVYRRPNELARAESGLFCSQACYGKSTRKEHPCSICGTPILAGSHKKTCSRACANKNRAGMRYTRNQPRDKVRTQRAVKVRLLKQRGGQCERCSYSKVEILEMHHKDRNRNNNSLANLELICPNCHAEEHCLKSG